MRVSPATMGGFETNAPPDGLMTVWSVNPSASLSKSSSWVYDAHNSATSIGASPTPAFSPASLAEGDS